MHCCSTGRVNRAFIWLLDVMCPHKLYRLCAGFRADDKPRQLGYVRQNLSHSASRATHIRRTCFIFQHSFTVSLSWSFHLYFDGNKMFVSNISYLMASPFCYFSEFLNLSWMKPDKNARAPGILRVTKRFNEVRVCVY